MSEHVTGQQARELLYGATPGPWEWATKEYPEHDADHETLGNGDQVALRSWDAEDYASWIGGSPQDKALAAAAPALAETVAWLYGADSEVERFNYGVWATKGGVDVATTGVEKLSPDEAVDLARALLAAAEKARRHTD